MGLSESRRFFLFERLVAPVRPQIFFSRTIEKLGRMCDQIGRTLEPWTRQCSFRKIFSAREIVPLVQHINQLFEPVFFHCAHGHHVFCYTIRNCVCYIFASLYGTTAPKDDTIRLLFGSSPVRAAASCGRTAGKTLLLRSF